MSTGLPPYSRSEHLLAPPEDVVVLLVDVQERFRPAIAGWDRLVVLWTALLEAARLLEIPSVFTEHYPEGLGTTARELAGYRSDATVVEKISFSAVMSDEFRARLEETGRRSVLVAGLEAHVCVLQTVCDLCSAGFAVDVLGDATASRRDGDRLAALHRMERAGARLSTVETALFELLVRADTPAFRPVHALIRSSLSARALDLRIRRAISSL